jgi:formiminotetrahydrofolate cyclodeaminase
MKASLEVLKLARVVAEKGNPNSITDAGVAGLMAMAAVHGAGYNVRINLTGIKDQEFVKNCSDQAKDITSEAEKLADDIKRMVEAKL